MPQNVRHGRAMTPSPGVMAKCDTPGLTTEYQNDILKP
nr:MAG TPA: hypothetical protein [Caudoviricetes sp.]